MCPALQCSLWKPQPCSGLTGHGSGSMISRVLQVSRPRATQAARLTFLLPCQSWMFLPFPYNGLSPGAQVRQRLNHTPVLGRPVPHAKSHCRELQLLSGPRSAA